MWQRAHFKKGSNQWRAMDFMRSCPTREWVMPAETHGAAFMRGWATAHPLMKAAIVGFVLWKNNAWNNSAFQGQNIVFLFSTLFISYWNKSAFRSATLTLGWYFFCPFTISDRWKSVFQIAAIRSTRAESSCVHQHYNTAWSSCAAAVGDNQASLESTGEGMEGKLERSS